MLILRKNGATSNTIRATLRNSSTGAGLTGLTHASSGLIVSTITDNEATPTTYTAAGPTIETITTLGTFAAPTSTKCRFKEVDSTNHPGLYEMQFADARFAVASAKVLRICVTGATSLLTKDIVVQLTTADVTDAANAPQTGDSYAVVSHVTYGLAALKTLIDAVMTTQMTEAYAADGVAPTPAQALFLIQQVLTEMSISGTTTTVKKLDGSTTAATLTLNSSTAPTSVTRAS